MCKIVELKIEETKAVVGGTKTASAPVSPVKMPSPNQPMLGPLRT
jgi:hypothetical protein